MHINDHNPLLPYLPAADRYDSMKYRYCGNSGIQLPEISLGLWHNFGHNADLTLGRKILRRAFDLGICHFDLANNYGPPFGSAEENFAASCRRIFFPTETNCLFLPRQVGTCGQVPTETLVPENT